MRNRHVLSIDVELTAPISDELAPAAAELLARDVTAYLKSEGWGYGVARVEAAYARVENEAS